VFNPAVLKGVCDVLNSVVQASPPVVAEDDIDSVYDAMLKEHPYLGEQNGQPKSEESPTTPPGKAELEEIPSAPTTPPGEALLEEIPTAPTTPPERAWPQINGASVRSAG